MEWNSDTLEYAPDLAPKSQIINLRTRCEIEPGVTLGDIFQAVQDDKTLMDFIAQYSWCWAIQEFHDEAKLPPHETIDTKIVEILIEAYSELHTARKGKKTFPEKPMSFNGVWLHFTGIGEDGVHYSISCTPMNELANVPVRLSNTCTFDKDFERLFEQPCEYCFSLLDVLDAIYFDISFHGSPSQNKEFIQGLKGMVDEINEHPEQLIEMKFDEDGEIIWEDLKPTDSSQDPQK